MEPQEQHRRRAVARAAQERSKRASDGRLRREIREAFARHSEPDQRSERHLRVQPEPRGPDEDRE
jgi:hypothetical protein